MFSQNHETLIECSFHPKLSGSQNILKTSAQKLLYIVFGSFFWNISVGHFLNIKVSDDLENIQM